MIDENEFRGKTAIITGAASGMGLLCGQLLARAGANVVLTDVNAAQVQAAAEAICREGGSAHGIEVDVRDYEAIEKAVTFTVNTFGAVDILINAAGGNSRRILNRKESFHELPPEVLEWGLDVNLKGPLFFGRAVMGQMIAQKGGVIINIGSIDGVIGCAGSPDYASSKAGLIGLTRSLALYGAPYQVRACCVSPGPVLTRPEMAQMKTPLNRAAEPIEVANFILYLCSSKAAYITGSNHLIDGGRAVAAMS